MGAPTHDDKRRLVLVVLLLALNLTCELLVVAQPVEVVAAPEFTSTHIRTQRKSFSNFRLANASTDPLSVTSVQVGSGYQSKFGFSVAVGHVDSPDSPLRPDNCSADDQTCFLHHRLTRHLTARKLEQTIRSPLYSVFEAARGIGDYYVQFVIGDPNKTPQFLLLDTASDLLWVQAFPCKRCVYLTNAVTPKYFPSRSTSNTNLGCADQACQTLRESEPGSYRGCGPASCSFERTYTRGPGAFIAGDLAKEAFTFTRTVAGSNAINVLLGVVYGKVLETVFPSPPIGSNGVLGLGGGNGGSQFSFPTQISGNFGNQFSFCFPSADSKSVSSLDFGPDSMPSPVVGTYYMPLKSGGNPNFYYVGLRTIFVGGTEVMGIPPDTFSIKSRSQGGVIIDTATPYTVLASPAYDAFQEAFVNSAEKIGLGPVYRTGLPQYFGLFDTCWDITGRPVVIPEVKFQFEDGGFLIFGRRALVVEVTEGKSRVMCLAILRAKDSVNAIGNFQMQNIRIAFDLRNKKLGWLGSACF